MFCTFKLNFDVDILAFFFCLLSILATFQKIGNFFPFLWSTWPWPYLWNVYKNFIFKFKLISFNFPGGNLLTLYWKLDRFLNVHSIFYFCSHRSGFRKVSKFISEVFYELETPYRLATLTYLTDIHSRGLCYKTFYGSNCCRTIKS